MSSQKQSYPRVGVGVVLFCAQTGEILVGKRKRVSRFRPVGVTRRRVGVERNVLVVRETRTARGNRDRFKRGLARGSARLPRRRAGNRRRRVFFPHLRIHHRRQQSLDNTLSRFLRKRERRERERANDGTEQIAVDLATSGGHSRADVYAAQETVAEQEVAKTILDDVIQLYHFLDDKQRVYV